MIDTAGNVWYASQSANKIVRYNLGNNSTFEYTTSSAPLAIFADGDTVSNIYFTTAADTSLYLIPQGASATVATTPIQISSVVGPNPVHIMVYKDQAVWVSSGSNFVSRVVAGASGDPNYLNGYNTTSFSVDTDAYGLAINDFGVYVSSNNANSSISVLAGSGTSYSMLSG